MIIVTIVTKQEKLQFNEVGMCFPIAQGFKLFMCLL